MSEMQRLRDEVTTIKIIDTEVKLAAGVIWELGRNPRVRRYSKSCDDVGTSQTRHVKERSLIHIMTMTVSTYVLLPTIPSVLLNVRTYR